MINKELQKRILSSIILIPTAVFVIIQGHTLFIFFLSLVFLITSYERAGEFNGEETYSLTLESSGQITHTSA